MNTLIAIPVTRGVLNEHFGHCKAFALVTVQNNQIAKEETIMAPPHEPGKLPIWLKDLGVNKVIAGGIGSQAIDILKKNDIEVICGAQPEMSKSIVEKYLTGNLTTKDNSCDH